MSDMKSSNQTIKQSNNFRQGFTLIEMLVVMGIIAVLIGASLVSFTKMSRSADKTKANELVSQTATALAAIYEADGMWPKSIRDANKDPEKGRLDDKIALILAKRGYMSLSLNKDSTKLVGRDRFGILTPWATKVVERLGSEATESTSVGSSGTVKDNILNFAVDLNGDGEITAEESGGRTGATLIRATVAVWCTSKDGKERVQSWTKDQARKIK